MSSDQGKSPSDLDPQTLSRLAGGLAHELKNPLSTISLHLGMLEEDWRSDDAPKKRRALRTLETVKGEVQRLHGILDDFLRYARSDALETEATDLNRLVEEITAFVQPEAERLGVRIHTYLDLDLPRAPLDADRVKQALLNLLINARQALEEEGGHVNLITRREDDEVVVEVVDDGPGMSPEALERCEEVYFSTKKNGSGLGMPTVRRIAEAHGGSMVLQSAPGRGTRVALRFPLHPEPVRDD